MKYAFEIDTCLGDPSRINSELSLSRHFLTNYLTRAHTRALFSQKTIENTVVCIDRPIERSARIVAMQFAWRGIGCWREKVTRSRVVFTRPV